MSTVMAYTRDYGGMRWTNHALARLKERKISQGEAYLAVKRPHHSRYAVTKGAWVKYRRFGNDKIEVVVSKNKYQEWVVMSVWKRPLAQSKKPKSGQDWWSRLTHWLWG